MGPEVTVGLQKLRWVSLLVSTTAALIGLGGSALAAAPSVDISGTWNCCGSGGAASQVWTISQSASGSLSGSGSAGGAVFATIRGSVSANNVDIVTTYTNDAAGYVATFVGSVDGTGTAMSGTWSSSIGQSGTWAATLASGAKRPSVTDVVCNLDFASGLDTCGAVVADGSGRSPVTPTGEVGFSSSGSGTLLGTACTLAATPFSPGVASCTVEFRPADTSSFPNISATYQGDHTFEASSGNTMLSGAGEIPPDEQMCLDGCANLEVDFPPTLEPGQDVLSLEEQESCDPGAQGNAIIADCQAHPCPPDKAWKEQYQMCLTVDEFREKLEQDDSAVARALALGIDKTYPWAFFQIVQEQINKAEQSVLSNKTTTKASTQFQQWQDYVNGDPAANAQKLQQVDSMLNPSFPPDSTSSGQARDQLTAHTASVGMSTGPSVSLVFAAIDKTHPTHADIAAFDQELALATAPTYTPARPVARATLVFAAAIGQLQIAHDLGARTLRQAKRLRMPTLGSVRPKLRQGNHTRVTLALSAMGGRILRVLDVIGLSSRVTLTFKVTFRLAHHRRATSRRQIRVL
jgi:hypothetical protein